MGTNINTVRGVLGALWAHACCVHTSQKPSCFVGQVANLRRIVNPPLVGQPILAAAGFQPALFAWAPAGFCRKRRSRQGSSVAHVNEKPTSGYAAYSTRSGACATTHTGSAATSQRPPMGAPRAM